MMTDGLSPFAMRMPEIAPPVLKPFMYCCYRKGDEAGAVDPCASLASTVIHEMAFCHGHGKLIQLGLDNEGLTNGSQ